MDLAIKNETVSSLKMLSSRSQKSRKVYGSKIRKLGLLNKIYLHISGCLIIHLINLLLPYHKTRNWLEIKTCKETLCDILKCKGKLGVHLGIVPMCLHWKLLLSLNSITFCSFFLQLIRLCGLTWYDFVELVDIERSGGSGVAWLSQTRTNSVTPETSSMARHSEPNLEIIVQKLM